MTDVSHDELYNLAMMQAAAKHNVNKTVVGVNQATSANPRQISKLKHELWHRADTVSQTRSPFRESSQYGRESKGDVNSNSGLSDASTLDSQPFPSFEILTSHFAIGDTSKLG